MKNYYDILGLPLAATESEIKQAYRKLAFKFHPDKNPGDSFFDDRFKEIQTAYDILMNPEKKLQYDRQLHAILFPKNASQPPPGPTHSSAKSEPTPSYSARRPSTNQSQNGPSVKKKDKTRSAGERIVTLIYALMNGLLSGIWDIVRSVAPRLAFLGILGGIMYGIIRYIDANPPIKSGSTVENGNLDSSFRDSTTEGGSSSKLTPEQRYQVLKKQVLAQGWNEERVRNGVMSSCYNFKPSYGKLANRLTIQVGKNTDVAIKVMELNSGKCIRYVYVNAASTYTIQRIPEGFYYLKIAYGTDWVSHVAHRKCVGKFLRGALYKRGENTLDFRRVETDEGYSVPSFSLQLDVIASDLANQFDSQTISEGDFNQ